MYYQEKVINGVLMYKTKPKGKWKAVSYDHLLQKYLDVKETRDSLSRTIDNINKEN